jgi:tetratricopeptide (TPR) repeat protein
VGDAPTVALVLHDLAHLALETGDDARAGAALERSLEIQQRQGHQYQIALLLRDLGTLARLQEAPARAVSYFEEAVAACREQGNRTHVALILHALANVFYRQGDYERARPAYAESLELFTQTQSNSSHWGIPCAGNNLGSTLFHLGDAAGARQRHREALALYQRRENGQGIVWSLERLAVVEAASGDAGKAVRLLGAAAAAREGLGKPMDPWDQEDWDQAVAAAAAALEPQEFDAAWAEGRALTLAQAVTYALEEARAD